jgi:hypothetical protein
MLSFAATILRIGSPECLDKATATRGDSVIAGVVCVSVTHPTSPSKEISRTFSALRTLRKVRERSSHRKFWKYYIIREYILWRAA